jgi:hypothetical protein
VTEVAATESPPFKEESSNIFGKPKQGQNPWEVAKILKSSAGRAFIDLKIPRVSFQESQKTTF